MAKTPKKNISLDTVNVIAELELMGYEFSPAGEGEIKLCCPACDEKNPSCSFNTEKRVWNCHSARCGLQGDIASFISFAKGLERHAVIQDLGKRYDLEVAKTINLNTVEKYHKEIWDSGPLLKALYIRGVTDDMIRAARLGFNRGRITIPVYNRQAQCINIRKYLPGAPTQKKMKNTSGYGGTHLYQVEQLKHPTIWITGGEMKALVAGAMLEPHGVGVVAPTAGEGNWSQELSYLFEDKKVYICLDVDQGGLVGALSIAGYIYSYATSVHIIKLPLDTAKHPKGDINDYVGTEGATDEDLVRLMFEADEWFPPDIEADEDPKLYEVRLSEATKADYVNKKIQVDGVITAMDTTPYIIPKTVFVKCDKNQMNCSLCPIKTKKPNEQAMVEVKVPSASPGILEMVNSSKKTQRASIMEALRIPTCKVVDFVIQDHYNVTDVRLTPHLTIGNESSKNIIQSAYVVSHGLEMNVPYIFRGKTFPKPNNQQAVLLLDDHELGTDDMISFDPSKEQLEELEVFQPDKWSVEGIEEQLGRIYADLETNVTRIYQRHDLHLIIDLTYHSALVFNFDDREVKGWVETLIIGDTSQGKSETTLRLREHYRLGDKADCKIASRAGLLGGLHQIGNKWFVSWGVIPTNDKRLVVLEEVKGCDPDVIASLTDMRSSGIAQISRIEKKKAFARTRLIFISNPKSDRSISQYNFGIEAIRELFSGPEDIRRFDAAIIVSSSQVDIKDINRLSINRPKVEHRFTSDLCNRLVLWAWTRKKEQIFFKDDAVAEIQSASTELSDRYTELVPLVDRGTTRLKLARLAAALAARTFSAKKGCLIIRKCHVEYIVNKLTAMYDDTTFGYKDFSKAQVHARRVRDVPVVKRQITGSKYPRDLVESLLYSDEITLIDIGDWCELDRNEARELLSLLVRKNAVYRIKRWYVKTSNFISLLKEMQSNGLAQTGTPSKGDKF